MNNSEKIYLALIGILSYVLYFKSKECKKCPEVVCEPSKTIYMPAYIPSNSSNVILPPPPPPKEDILYTALVYTGPSKFQIPDRSNSNIGIVYFVENTKYYKVPYTSGGLTDMSLKTEISTQEIIDAWNSTK
jgi:hypothetical protein